MIKDIMTNLDVNSARAAAADYAISVARTFEAHVSAIAFAYEEVLPETLVSRFEEAARRSGVSAEARVIQVGFEKAGEMFGRLARRFDLAVVAQAEPDKLPARQPIIEAALFDSGRPILLVPYIQREGLRLDRVMVCWDGSRTAARAVGDAMSFLAKAKAVEIVLVASEAGKSNEIAGADIAHHLARHGLKVELKQIVVRDLDVGNTILSHAADTEADFIVMGGYGHSRLREFVLGGATRSILSAMTVPILMSH
jgi:nucleotide-binding universal stress UspA family protein